MRADYFAFKSKNTFSIATQQTGREKPRQNERDRNQERESERTVKC